MAEIFLDPKGFQGQIDSFKSGADTIRSLAYALEKQGVQLQSIDKYMECIEAFNEAIVEFGKMLEMDTESMKQIKAAWMNQDAAIATKTLGEILSGMFFGSST